MCDSDLNILNLVAKFPGSTHDSYIWNTSALCAKLEDDLQTDGYLLGDSGYPLKSYLLTPYLNPVTDAEKLYNKRHRKARCCIERTFGVMKSRFHCISKFGGSLMYSPSRCCDIITTVAVLHNLCNKLRVPYDEQEVQQHIQDVEVVAAHEQAQDGIQLRIQVALRLQNRQLAN